jgi:hypothetical protein
MPLYSHDRLKKLFAGQESPNPEIRNKWKLCHRYYNLAGAVCVLGIVYAGILRQDNSLLGLAVGVGLIAIAIFLEYISQHYQQQISNILHQRGEPTAGNQ